MSTYRKILVPLDGSALAENALPFAETLASLFEAELHLLRVNEPLAFGENRLTAVTEEEVVRYLEQIRARLEARGVRVRWDRAMGSAHEAIQTYVRGCAIDLVAMATHGAGGSTAHGFGSVALKCLRTLDLPLYLVRSSERARPAPAAPPRRPERILVPLDGSELAEEILTRLETLLHRYDAEVRLIRIVPSNTMMRSRHGGAATDATREAAGYLAKTSQGLQSRGVKTGPPISLHGDPADEILRAASDLHADLVAMCTHGRSGFSRWFFGSVAEKVLAAARAPMLIVRARG